MTSDSKFSSNINASEVELRLSSSLLLKDSSEYFIEYTSKTASDFTLKDIISK